MFKNKENFLPLLLVLIVTIIVFSTTLSNDFVNWDDDINILENTNLEGFSLENIGRIFHPEYGRIIGNYNPLPILTFAIEKATFGLNPTVFHFNNLLLHLLCVFFVFLLGKRLGLSIWATALFALLFGIHPMRVESVAWATERKDVLFGVFYLGAMLTYIRFLTEKKSKFLWLTLLLFVFSLFSKIQAVSLPLSLLILDYWFNRSIEIKLILEKWAFWLLSLAFGLAGIYFLGSDGSLKDATNFSMFERLLVGAYSYCIYLIKWIFPYEMSPLYPYPSKLSTAFYIAPIGVLGAFALFIYAWKKNYRALVFGLGFFTVNIVFLLQILGAGQGFIADRFTYMAYLGLFFLIAYAYDYFKKNKPKFSMPISIGLGIYLLIFSWMSFQQVKVWKNGLTLWTHVNKYYDHVTTPWVNLGHYYRDKKDVKTAIKHYTKAISINPKKGEIYNSRGKLLMDNGQAKAALEDFEKGTNASPEIAEIYINKGAANGMLNRYNEALAAFNKGIELDPDAPNGYLNRSMIFYMTQKYPEAIKDYDKYLKFNPFNADIWFEKGLVCNLMQDYNTALTCLNRAIKMKPNNSQFYKERAKAYDGLGQREKAATDRARQ